MSRHFNNIKDLLLNRIVTDPFYTSFPVYPKMKKERNVKIDFALGVQPFDPAAERIPVLIVGNIRLIKLMQFDDVRAKLEPLVTREVSWKTSN